MKLKLVASAVIIAAVVGGGYAASQALFRDTEQSTDSKFTVGTLDLSVDGNNGTAFEKFDVTNLGDSGTAEGGKTWTITNSGSLPGLLTFALANLQNNENGCNEPESEVDTTCENPGTGSGELGSAITTSVLLNSNPVISANLATASLEQYATQWKAQPQRVLIPPGQSVQVSMNWATSPENYGNEIQSDSVSFDVMFTLEQVNPQGGQ